MTDVKVINPTTVDDVDVSIPEWWSDRIRREFLGKLLWGQFFGGEGSNMPVIMKEDLSDRPGDVVKFDKVAELTGAGQSGDADTLTGNEEVMVLSQIEVEPVRYRHAVAFREQAQRKSIHDLRNLAVSLLSNWAAKKVDTACYTAATAGTQILYAGTAAATGDIAPTDYAKLKKISKAAAILRKNNVPVVPGLNAYVCIMHTYQAYQIVAEDTNYVTVNTEAQVRGPANPVFQHFTDLNCIGEYDGVYMFETSQVPTVTGASGDIAGAVVMGAEAFAFALGNYYKGKLPIQWSEETQDYGDITGVGIKFAYQVKELNDESYVRLFTACDAPS